MSIHLTDMESLALKCRSEQSKSYIGEAVACYNVGSYRASITMTWIAVAFDLIDKVRELKNSDNAAANEIWTKFENYQNQIENNNPQGIKSALEFEREIIQNVSGLELLSSHEMDDLKRLQQDRHRCAHPTFHNIELIYQPSPEQARLHIYNAVSHLISQVPTQGKEALKSILKAIESDYFPREEEEAKKVLFENHLQKPKESLITGLIDKLFFSVFDKDHNLYRERKVIEVINILIKKYGQIATNRVHKTLTKIQKKTDDENLDIVINATLLTDGGWQFTEDSEKAKFKKYIQSGPTKKVIRLLEACIKNRDLEKEAKNIIKKLSIDEMAHAAQYYNLREHLANRATQLFCSSDSWITANKIQEKVITKLIYNLSPEQVEEVIDSAVSGVSDLQGSHGFKEFLQDIVSKYILPKEDLLNLLETKGIPHYMPDVSPDDEIPF